MKAQRTNPFAAPGFHYHSLTPAGQAQVADFFHYHEFGLVGAAVWDGCIKFQTPGVPKGWDRDSTYYYRLVNYYASGGSWVPTPTPGFTPAVTTDPIPTP